MKHIPVAIFSLGAIMLGVHLFQKLVTGIGSADASDAMGVLVLAGVAAYLFKPSLDSKPSQPDTSIR